MIEQGNAAKTERSGSRRAGAGAPVPRSSSKKSDRLGRLSRAIRPPAHIQERVAAALVGARSRRRRPACLAAAVTRLLLWTNPHPALQANGVPATRATPPEKSDPSVDLLVRIGPLSRIRRESPQSPWVVSAPSNPSPLYRCTSCGDSLSLGGLLHARLSRQAVCRRGELRERRERRPNASGVQSTACGASFRPDL